MRSLYLLRPHGTAGIEGEQLVVRSEEQELDRMGLPLLDQILVVGQMQLTTQLIRACLRRGIPIAYLSSSGQCLGRLQPLEGGYRHRARRQAELPQERRLALARALVSGKIANGRVVLQRFTRSRRLMRSAVSAMACSGMRCCCGLSCGGWIPTTACCMWGLPAMQRWCRI